MAAKSSKVKAAEYVDPADETVEAKPAARSAKAEGVWELGKPAPSTQYRDYVTGEITEAQPQRATVIVFEGDTVTEHILRRLGK